jgi:hypothetical protein
MLYLEIADEDALPQGRKAMFPLDKIAAIYEHRIDVPVEPRDPNSEHVKQARGSRILLSGESDNHFFVIEPPVQIARMTARFKKAAFESLSLKTPPASYVEVLNGEIVIHK